MARHTDRSRDARARRRHDRDLSRLAGRQREAVLGRLATAARELADRPDELGRFARGLLASPGAFLPGVSPDARHGLGAEDLYAVVARAAGPEVARRALGGAGRGAAGAAVRRDADGHLARAGRVRDPDAARRVLTESLLERLGASLGLGSAAFDVRADAEARRRTEAGGTRGLLDGGTIYLHPERYRPETPDGRGLLAHEVTHLAQRRVDGRRAPSARLAEAEAHLNADAFAAGRGVARAEVRLPSAHVAKEGPGPAMPTDSLGGELSGYKAAADGALEGMKGKLGGDGKGSLPKGPTERPKQSREEKYEQYCDGVDGIADLIGDLDAFDDLCEAIDDDEDTSGPLARVKRSSHYKKLCDMWQGAKEGGEDSGRMKQAFNNEFDGRGFWAETEEAFALICRHAKRDAKPKPEAANAKADAKKAGEDAGKAAKQGADGKGGAGAKGGAKGPGIPGVGADILKRLNEPVPDKAPSLPEFEKAQQTHTGGLFKAVSEEFGHYDTHAGSIKEAAEGGVTDRFPQVMEQLGKGLLFGGIKGTIDQGADTLILDTLGSVGDLGLKALTKGKMKAPFVGPAISLVQSGLVGDVFSGDIFKGKGKFVEGLQQSWGNITENASNFAKNAEAAHAAFASGNIKDGIGLLCASAADFLGMLAEVIDTIANILGILSALCYVIGGILILVGLALAWLGIGASMIPVGGWFVKAGGVLGRIVTALGPISIALNAVALVFRVASALLVPAEHYAQQLEGVGQNAAKTSGKVSAKVADVGATEAKNRAAQKIKAKSPKSDPPANKGQDEGGDVGDGQGAQVKKVLDDGTERVKEGVDEAKALEGEYGDVLKPPKDGEEGGGAPTKKKGPGEDDAEAPEQKKGRGGEDDADAPPTQKPKGPGFMKAVMSQVAYDLNTAPRNLWGAVKDLGSMAKVWDLDLQRAHAYDGAGPAADLLRKQKGEADAKVAELKAKLEELDKVAASQKKLLDDGPQSMGDEGGGMSPSYRRKLMEEAKATQKELAKARSALKWAELRAKNYDKAVKKIDESAAADDKARLDEERAKSKEAEGDPVRDLDDELAAAKKKAADDKADAKKAAKKGAKELPELERQREALQKQHDDVEAEVRRLQEEVATQKKTQKAAETEIETLEAKRKALDAQIADATAAVKAFEEAQAAKREAEVLAQQKAKLEGDAEQAEKIAQAKEAAPEAQEALSGKQDRVLATGAAKDRLKAEAAAVAKEQKQNKQQLEQLKAQFQARANNPKRTIGVPGPDGQMQKVRIAEVHNDGVVVHDPSAPGGKRKVAWDEVQWPAALANNMQQAQKRKADLEKQRTDADEKVKIAEDLMLEAVDDLRATERTLETAKKSEKTAAELRADADAKRGEAGTLDQQLAAAKEKAEQLADQEARSAAEARKIEVERQAAELDAQVAGKKKELGPLATKVTDKEAEVAEKEKARGELNDQLNDAKLAVNEAKADVELEQRNKTVADRDAAAAEEKHAAGMAEAKGVKGQQYTSEITQDNLMGNPSTWKEALTLAGDGPVLARILETPSSGNATGGVGSAYNEWIGKVADGSFQDNFSEMGTLATGGPGALADKRAADEEKKKEEEKAAGPSAEDVLLGKDKEAEEKKKTGMQKAADLWNDKGKNAASWVVDRLDGGVAYADIIKEPPPHDPAELGKIYEEAEAEATAFHEQHVMARAAFLMEEKAKEHLEAGEEIQSKEAAAAEEAAVNQAKPLEDGKAKEAQRRDKLNSKDPGTKKADPEGGSLSELIVSKLMDFADYVKDKPSGGATKSAGKDSGKAQDKADEDAKKTKKDSEDGSQKQTAFLDKLSVTQGLLVQRVKADRAKLDQKIQQDRSEKEQIQIMKATYLVQRDQHKAKAEQKAADYNAKMALMIPWAAAYKQRRLQAQGKLG